jgi:hypothetical protein
MQLLVLRLDGRVHDPPELAGRDVTGVLLVVVGAAVGVFWS